MAQDNKNKVLNVPPLRFPEFIEPWDIAFLENYLVENKERNKNGDFTKNDVLSVSGEQGVVNQIELLGRSFAGKSVIPYHIARHNNIIYTKSPLSDFPYGIVKMNRGVDGIVSTLYAVYNVLPNADASFVEFYFALKHRANRYFKPIVRIGAKHDMKIGNAEVLHNLVKFPQIEEQQRISAFLELIDERIATQNKIIEDLKKLKSAIVENTYRSQTSVIPLSEILEQVSVRAKGKNDLPVLSVSNTLGFIAQSEQFESREVASADTSNYKVVSEGIIAYNPARINVGSVACCGSDVKGIVSPMYVCFRTKAIALPQYVFYYMRSRSFQLEMEKRLEGSVRLCLTFEGLCNIHIPLPELHEQRHQLERIKAITHKIEMENEYSNLLQLQRQYLLTKMFI